MTVPGIDTAGDGGLLGLAVSPTFLEDGLFYAYVSTATDNRVVRFPLGGTPNPVFTGIPRGETHNGGGLVFGLDGTLYVGTGDVGDPALAGDPASLAGKVLHIDVFGRALGAGPVHSTGHRNVTGLCQSLEAGEVGAPGEESLPTATLYATDDAAQGPDAVDRVTPGADYSVVPPLIEIPAEEGAPGAAPPAVEPSSWPRWTGSGCTRSPWTAPGPWSATRRSSWPASTAGCAPSSSMPRVPSGSPRPTGTASVRRSRRTTGSSGSCRRPRPAPPALTAERQFAPAGRRSPPVPTTDEPQDFSSGCPSSLAPHHPTTKPRRTRRPLAHDDPPPFKRGWPLSLPGRRTRFRRIGSRRDQQRPQTSERGIVAARSQNCQTPRVRSHMCSRVVDSESG
ncbi:PQQ-dependent sugar dehydrogenase [Blastococcus brunescens]|uniref:PQQ-dependent sugar dehydrogenase n=1 Tax=Blastococcus brunescens TaxID=1564165 RepID=A0ABZ1AYY3_9ACTN|nr:PQQ-dependent sugar dehydrogenase [Blastococcus sp. BMG 8361]WRL62633.1 PQQ-dependent sugar dehydrogenase [Blastococcus sp. BMG 8361]